MNSNEIQSRQNDERLLRVQYAAREHYNSAERLNHYAWFLCLVSAFSVFLPDSWPTLVSFGIPFAADLIALYLILLVGYKVMTAAKLRKYFDAFVLNINFNQFSENEHRTIKEIAGKTYLNNPNKAEIQMANTAKDSPPGVREWYVFPEQCIGISAQLECQRQNTWWNKKMFHKRLFITICTSVFVGVAFLVLMANNHILIVLFCSAGLIIKIVERLIENGRYIWISIRIDAVQETVEADSTIKGIEKLQTLIDERRSINVLELNWYHKKDANPLSRLYENSIL